jgi:hypothetical protein
MTDNSSLPTDVADTVTDQLLTRFGARVPLGMAETLAGSDRTQVWRVSLSAFATDIPASVVVKRLNPDNATPLSEWAFWNDWASLTFLQDFGSFAPRFLAGDNAARLFIMEDLGSGMRLDHALLGADPLIAEAYLLDYAAIHGRMHARTFGHVAEYRRIRESLAPIPSEAAIYASHDWLPESFARMLADLDLVSAPGVAADVERLLTTVRYPDPFQTFIQGDACPDNCIRGADGGVRLLDFEGGMAGHALLSGAYARMRFPTCWCVNELPAGLAERMEGVYRAELARGCPAARDDALFNEAVAAACVFWLLEWCREFSIQRMSETDNAWREATVRQRFLARLDYAARFTATTGNFAALGATFTRIRDLLLQRWPAETHRMPLYPAFTAADRA